jgi:hypothetical protein
MYIKDEDEQKSIYSFVVTVVGLSSKTREFKHGYQQDPHFYLIYKEISAKIKRRNNILNKKIPPNTTIPYPAFKKIDTPLEHDINYAGF